MPGLLARLSGSVEFGNPEYLMVVPVGNACGFNSSAGYSVTFRELTDTTPLKYRWNAQRGTTRLFYK